MNGKSTLVVAKAGSNFLNGKVYDKSGAYINQTRLECEALDILARDTSYLWRSRTIPVAWITSGAVALGREKHRTLFGFDLLPDQKREAAGIGARHLLNAWGDAFEPYGTDVAQIWVTYEPNGVISNACDIREKILFYVTRGIVPIINYNDVVSSTELELGDNDHLAVEIGNLIGADSLLFLTERGGVESSAGSGRRYSEVDARNLPVCQKVTSSSGTGGMASKLQEAVRFYANGARRVSIAGDAVNKTHLEGMLSKFAHGEPVGTMIGTSNILYP